MSTLNVEKSKPSGAVTGVRPKLLLVDDNEALRLTLPLVLEKNGFDVVAAASVPEALKLIGQQEFEVLLTDLHMPDAGDGLTVVSAMRHSQPRAVTLIFSAFPEMQEAAAAILSQADAILVKPQLVESLVETVRDCIARGPAAIAPKRTLPDLMEQQMAPMIAAWQRRVDDEPDVITVRMSPTERSEHLPQLFRDLIFRLRFPLPLGTRALVSAAAALHGAQRCRQGYTAAMLVEESRMLQVSIFEMLQNHLAALDFSLLLIGVMSIADEVDSQLAQSLASYLAESTLAGQEMVAYSAAR